MSGLMQMVNRAVGGGRRRGGAGLRAPAGRRPMGSPGGATRGSAKDEAIGRGVRGLLRRFR